MITNDDLARLNDIIEDGDNLIESPSHVESLKKIGDLARGYLDELNFGKNETLPTRIYTIWTGQYSDRCVECFCYSEEEAKRICAYLNDSQTGGYKEEYYYDYSDIYTGELAEKACYPYEVFIEESTHKIIEVKKLQELSSVKHAVEIFLIYPNWSVYCVYCGTPLSSDSVAHGECSRCGQKILLPERKPQEYKIKIYSDGDEHTIRRIACDALAQYLAEKEGL